MFYEYILKYILKHILKYILKLKVIQYDTITTCCLRFIFKKTFFQKIYNFRKILSTNVGIPLPTFVGRNFSEVIIFLESNITDPFKLSHENVLMANSSKNHFLISPYKTKSIQKRNSCIKACVSEELLGIKIDSNLTFHDHIISLCSKANKKLSDL